MDRLAIQKEGAPVEFSYDIVWEHSFNALADEIIKALGKAPAKICVVTETTVAPLYLDTVTQALAKTGSEIFSVVLNSGEEHKNLFEIQRLYEQLVHFSLERKDLMIALGGGVIGDMTGFAAATYLRGISFVQVPTTLLAQIDSSVGGKTGVDFDQFKNMVGAFHQPRLVYMNLATLHTLPPREFSAGMGEVVKSALIYDRPCFDWLEQNSTGIMEMNPEDLQKMIRCTCVIKADVVRQDPKEAGLRAILNYGHTIGHAVEKLSDFSILHGECVAIGMAAALQISLKRGQLKAEDVKRIRRLIHAYRLPLTVKEALAENVATSGPSLPVMTADEILRATKSDKKMERGSIRFILLDAIGSAVIDRTVTDEEILNAAETILS